MKKVRFLVIGLAMMGLVGCVSFNTPDATLKTFAHALKKNDPELYTRSLTGIALEKCGNLHGMMNIQDELQKFKNVTHTDPKLTSSSLDEIGRIIEQNYEVLIHGSNPNVPYELNWNFTISCESTYFGATWDPINHTPIDQGVEVLCKISKMDGVFCGGPQLLP